MNPGRPAASVEVNVAVIHGKVLVQSSTAGSGPGVRPRLQIGASKLFAPWPQQTSTAWKSTRFRFFSLPMRLPMPPQDIVSVEAYKLTASVALDVEGNSRLDASLADISVHDLCSDPGVSEVPRGLGDFECRTCCPYGLPSCDLIGAFHLIGIC